MFNIKYSFILACLMLCLSPILTAHGADFSVATWHTTGSQIWRTSFPLSTKTDIKNGASELFYPQSGTYIMTNYENKINSTYKLRIEGGFMAKINNTIGSDSDWDYNQNSEKQYYGVFNTGGTSRFFNIDLVKPISPNADFFYGYGYRNNHFSMKNGVYNVWDYKPTNMAFEDLNSYYTTTYQGLHFGISAKTPLNSKLSIKSTLSYSPLAIAHGHGWWNLRNLDFKHQAPAQMFDTSVGIQWQPTHANIISIGYRYQFMKISSGWENLSKDITWEKATNIQQGFYLNTIYKF